MTQAPVILVTGASGGLGNAIARCLGWTGASLVLMARRKAVLEQVRASVESLGGKALVVAGDVTDPEACRHAVDQAEKSLGGIDALINNAGVIDPLAVTAEASIKDWQNSLTANLLGPFCLIRSALPSLRRRRGCIINISSGAAQIPIYGAGAYCAAKAALNHLTRVLALEEPAVAAVAIRPGMVDTPMQDRLRHRAAEIMPPEQSAVYRNARNNGRLQPPRLPAQAIAWLALHPPHDDSGAFLSWDDPRIALPAQTFFKNCPA